MPLPTNRTTANTAAEHVADHNDHATLLNALPATYAAATTVAGGGVARVNEGPLSLLDSRVGCLLDGSNEAAKLTTAVSMLPSNGGVIFQPPGTLGLSSMEITGRISVVLRGAGPRASRIFPVGGGSAPTLKFTDCRDITLRDLWIEGRGATATSVVESRRSSASPTYNSRGMVLDSLFLGSTGSNNALTGFRTTAAALADSNNDIHDIRNVECANLIDAAYSFEHYNSLCHTIYGGKVASCGRVVRTLAAGGGAFTLVGGFFEDVATLFDIGGAVTHPFMMYGFGAEACGQILKTATAEVTIFMGGFGFYGAPTGTDVIDFASSGYLSMEGWSITGQPDTRFRFSHASGRVVVKSGAFGISDVKYNGALRWPEYIRQLSGITFTNLGSGVLNAHEDLVNSVDVGGTSVSLALTHQNKVIRSFGDGGFGAVTLTVPPVSSVPFPVGFSTEIYALFGQVTVVGGSGVTILSAGNKFKSADRYSVMTLRHDDTNSWMLSGDRTT